MTRIRYVVEMVEDWYEISGANEKERNSRNSEKKK